MRKNVAKIALISSLFVGGLLSINEAQANPLASQTSKKFEQEINLSGDSTTVIVILGPGRRGGQPQR